MSLRKVLSVVGILIPIIFVLSFGYLFGTNLVYLEVIDEVPIFCYNIKELVGSIWIRIFNYFLIGLLIIIFSLGLMKLNSKSFSNNLALLFLSCTGFIWCSFSFFSVSINDEDQLGYAFNAIYVFLLLAFLSFLTLSSDVIIFIKNKSIKIVLLVISMLIFLETILASVIPDYPFMIPNLTILFYVSIFPILGYNLNKEIDSE